jgi:ABC-type antimicrobial peptide transport system permease subunit
MKAPHILVFSSFVCFGIGMLLGENLAGTVWWIVALVATAMGCIAMMFPFNRRKKRLPVRRSSLRVVKSRKVANNR